MLTPTFFPSLDTAPTAKVSAPLPTADAASVSTPFAVPDPTSAVPSDAALGQAANPPSFDTATLLPGGSSSDIADLKAHVADVLGELEIPEQDAAGTPLEAVTDTLADITDALAQIDTALGSMLLPRLEQALASLEAVGQDVVVAASPAGAAAETVDLIARVLEVPSLAKSPLVVGEASSPPVLALAPLLRRAIAQAPATNGNPMQVADLTGAGAFEGLLDQASESTRPTSTALHSALAASHTDLRQTVLRQIANAHLPTPIRQGETTTLELTPLGLGRLELEIDTNPGGGLRIILRADNPLVLDALRTDRGALEAALTGDGSPSGFDFEAFAGNGQSQADTHADQTRQVPSDDASHEPTPDRAPHPVRVEAGALILDILA